MFGNWVKTSILFAGIIALFGAIGAAIGGAQGRVTRVRCGWAARVSMAEPAARR